MSGSRATRTERAPTTTAYSWRSVATDNGRQRYLTTASRTSRRYGDSLKLMVDEFALEEYKSLKERINKLEERRYAILLFNFTGIAAATTLRGSEAERMVPFLLLGLLFICAENFHRQAVLQRLNTTYLIERYESRRDLGLGFESGYLAWASSDENEMRGRLYRHTAFWLRYCSDPFVALTLINLCLGLTLVGGPIARAWHAHEYIWTSGFVFVLGSGHGIVLWRIFTQKQQSVRELRRWWSEYLEAHTRPFSS
jgi:hypothetical protein